MGLIAVKETAELFRRKNISMTERDTEFVVQFAFRINDRELTEFLYAFLHSGGICPPDFLLAHGNAAGRQKLR